MSSALLYISLQYTDGGMYTCSKGGRSHLIPGSNGMMLSLQIYLMSSLLSQDTTNKMLRRMPRGEWNVSLKRSSCLCM